ncbi:hypothetical protein J6590_049711 [Homalodisca vitripennis]|nr:hypothetical protein J6590_049711 [Homalodisca vitripennis]
MTWFKWSQFQYFLQLIRVSKYRKIKSNIKIREFPWNVPKVTHEYKFSIMSITKIEVFGPGYVRSERVSREQGL